MGTALRARIREIFALAVVVTVMTGIELGRAFDAGRHSELFGVCSIGTAIVAFVMARWPAVQPPSRDPIEITELMTASTKPHFIILQGNWIRWPGDADCPVPPNTVIETIHGNGAAFTGRYARYAKEWQFGWRHGESIALDILFFRIVR